MEIIRLEDDLNIISKLSDEPNDIEGLSASELKAQFDAAGNTIKSYINGSLIPDIERGIVSEVDKANVKAGNLPAGGTAGQTVIKRSDEDYDWELATPHMIPPGGKTHQLLRKASDADFDVLFSEPSPLDWTLLSEYLSAGVYTWTAPDIYGDGRPYEVGAFIIGGGTSGSAVAAISPSYPAVASGGASGYTEAVIARVTPGQAYPLVVGEGGAAGAATYGNPAPSNNGGSSSFLSAVAFGGEGVNGGQGAAKLTSSTPTPYKAAPSRGTILATATTPTGGIEPSTGDTTPIMSLNPFNSVRYLAAGGGSRAGSSQVGADLGIAGRSGDGANSTSAAGNIAAGSGTTHGCGGGSAVRSVAQGPITGTTASGAGAPGAVMIYVRWPVGTELPGGDE